MKNWIFNIFQSIFTHNSIDFQSFNRKRLKRSYWERPNYLINRKNSFGQKMCTVGSRSRLLRSPRNHFSVIFSHLDNNWAIWVQEKILLSKIHLLLGFYLGPYFSAFRIYFYSQKKYSTVFFFLFFFNQSNQFPIFQSERLRN